MAYQGTLSEGRSACLAIFDHPGNRQFPSTWLVRDNYPYMNPTFPCKQDVTLKPEESLTLRYGILVHEGPITRQGIERRWQRFSKKQSRTVDAARFDPVVQNIEGWTVHVDPQMLAGEQAEAGAKALTLLANHLQRIAILVPEEQLTQLRDLEIWIEHHHPTLGAMQYHPSVDWLRSHGHDPRLAGKVHITRAASLLSRQQMIKHPAVVLHELAHAYHDQVLGFDHPRIIAVYEEAKAAGIYEKSLLYDGKTVRHYGLSNHKEYFAEGTEAYFYRNDFYPFCRAELHEHDPALHDLLEEIWGPIP
jgi:dipeptidyl-peptidase-4